MKTHNSTFLKLIFPAFAMLLLQSCVTFSYYYPQKSFQPLVSKKMDVQADLGAFQTNKYPFKGFGGNAAIAFSNHSFIHLGGDFGSGTRTDSFSINDGSDNYIKTSIKTKSAYNNVRIGYGYYNSVLPKLSIGAMINFASGMVNYKTYNMNNGGVQNGERGTQFANVSLNAFATFHIEHFDFSFMPGYTSSVFTKVTNNAAIAKGTSHGNDMLNMKAGNRFGSLQPGFQINYGFKMIKFYANYTWYSQMSGLQFANEHANISLGLVFKMNLIPTKN